MPSMNDEVFTIFPRFRFVKFMNELFTQMSEMNLSFYLAQTSQRCAVFRNIFFTSHLIGVILFAYI